MVNKIHGKCLTSTGENGGKIKEKYKAQKSHLAIGAFGIEHCGATVRNNLQNAIAFRNGRTEQLRRRLTLTKGARRTLLRQ